METFKTKILLSFGIMVEGFYYQVIFGEYKDEYFACIPDWLVGCKMSEPIDIGHNAKQLQCAGITRKASRQIAKTIYELSKGEDEV